MENYKFSRDIEQQIARLKTLDNWHGISALIEDVLVVIIAITLSLWSPFCYPISLIVIGSRIRAFASLLHESAHGTLVCNKAINYAIGVFSGWVVLQLPAVYKKSHVKNHHIYLGNIEKDPDFQYHMEVGLYKKMTGKEFLQNYVYDVLLFKRLPSVLHYIVHNRLLGTVGQLNDVQIRNEFSGLVCFWLLCIILCAEFGWLKELCLFWLFPYLTTFPIIN